MSRRVDLDAWVAALRAVPPENSDQDQLQALFSAMHAANMAIPPDLEERSLRLIIAERPDHQEAMQRLFAVMQMQGKPIPPDLEERALWLILKQRPNDQAVLQRLFQLLQIQGKEIPSDLEERALRLILDERLDDQNALNRLFQILRSRGDNVPHDLRTRSIQLIGASLASTDDYIGTERVADFFDLVIARLLRKHHKSVFWGDRLLTLDKSAGFLDEPSFAAAYAAIRGSHVYDQYESPNTIAWRLHTLVWAARGALSLPTGDLVECGVFAGDMAWVVYNVAGVAGSGRHFHLYDSFEGFHPELTSQAEFPDLPGFVDTANRYYRRPGLYEAVISRFASAPEVIVRKGFLPESLDGTAPDKISFLHIDLNSARAEVGCLEHLFDRVVPGGYIVFDDYGWKSYRAQKEAEDQFFAERGYRVLELPTGQGLVVKRPSN